MQLLCDKRVYLQHGFTQEHLDYKTLSQKKKKEKLENFQSPKPAVKLFHQKTHMAEMTKPYKMEKLVKGSPRRRISSLENRIELRV